MMGRLGIPIEVLPPVVRAEILALERDFAHLAYGARLQAVRANLSSEAWAYLDGLVAERLQSFGPEGPVERGACAMDDPEPRAVEGEDLTIAVKLRLVLKDQQWHAVPALAGRVAGYASDEVMAVIAQLVANGQLEHDETTDPPRCRLASRLR